MYLANTPSESAVWFFRSTIGVSLASNLLLWCALGSCRQRGRGWATRQDNTNAKD